MNMGSNSIPVKIAEVYTLPQLIHNSLNLDGYIILLIAVHLLPQDLDEEMLKEEPLIYCHFASGIGEPKYLPVPSWETLNRILEEALESYNEINAVMNLVLFEDAMHHMYRIWEYIIILAPQYPMYLQVVYWTRDWPDRYFSSLLMDQLSHQPHPGVPPRQRSPSGSGWQWKTESHSTGSLSQWTRGLPDPAT